MKTSDIFRTVTAVFLAALLLSGCDSPAKPVNLEPAISRPEVASVTRTEAVITSAIEKRGVTVPDKVRLLYALLPSAETAPDIQDTDWDTVDAESVVGPVSVTLSGLTPGRSYCCFIEAATSTAILTSDTIHFTTSPNDRPKVSAPVPLSAGPVGVIVEFTIIDDGGEPLTEAGCEVRHPVAGEARRIFIPQPDLAEGIHSIPITGLTPETTYTVTPFASNTAGETRGEPLTYTTLRGVVLTEPGGLSRIISTEDAANLPRLVISGEMDGDDFRFLRLLLGAPLYPGQNAPVSGPEEVDLTEVRIVEGGASYDGARFTSADEVSTGLFACCPFLKRLILPDEAVRVAREAFAASSALESVTIGAKALEILPSADCPALAEIVVSKANDAFTSVDGVLFNKDATEIKWFPLGKTGEYTLPSTITAIGENAFAGTSITSLRIPDSVTVIERGAFDGSSLTEIRLPGNLTNVAEAMFQDCAHLTAVHLGAATSFIGDYAFDGTPLQELYIAAEVPPYANTNAFTNHSSDLFDTCTLYVPTGTRAIYRNHARWGRFNRIEEF